MTATDTSLEQLPTLAGIVPLGMTKRGAFIIEREDTPYEAPPWRPKRQPGQGGKTSDRREINARIDDSGKVTSVTETRAERFDGVSNTGKPFTRWRTKSLTSIRVHAGGKQTVFFRKFGRRNESKRVCCPRYQTQRTHLLDPAGREARPWIAWQTNSSASRHPSKSSTHWRPPTTSAKVGIHPSCARSSGRTLRPN